MQRIERIYQPEQFPAKDRLWSDLVGILALRPKVRLRSLLARCRPGLTLINVAETGWEADS